MNSVEPKGGGCLFERSCKLEKQCTTCSN